MSHITRAAHSSAVAAELKNTPFTGIVILCEKSCIRVILAVGVIYMYDFEFSM